ncbi:MAG TPA: squalene--hopene cyclase [Blastocatellia bacterium]|jgi:squalene-hopene/tetraprenyl-beta-curcumene cyclase
MTAFNHGPARLARVDESLRHKVQRAIEAAQAHLLQIQHADGHWCGELEGDTILESEYILTMRFVGRSREDRCRKAANYVRQKMLPEGGWAIYEGGPPEVSASSKAYFVLKLLGDSSDAPHMKKARQVICDLGGLDACNSFTKIYFAIFGQYPWERCPAVPPEIILLPTWAPINLYEMSSWSRGIVVPLSVIWASKPYCQVPEHANIEELELDKSVNMPARRGFWKTVFHTTDFTLKVLERKQWSPSREKALKACEQWMIEHFEKSDGIGAIFPPIINSIIALRCLGYENDHPLTASQIRELEKLEIEDGDTLRIAPCFSPVWDTALAVNALAESGLPADHPALQRAAEWMLDKEVKEVGDWKVRNPEGSPGGWYFEYANEFYPDVDDTFQVLTALSKVRFQEEQRELRKREARDRALAWVLTMQNKDGGWGSFDRDCDEQFLTQIPFADHNAMIDPSTSDITARGIEAFSNLGFRRNDPVVLSARAFLAKEQERDGSWFGRWGCNYIYGTWLALHGLKCIGEDMLEPRYQAAGCWLRAIQNEDGGWGELPASYEDPGSKGQGPSTASQTAWALMGLMAAEDQTDGLKRGIEYLISTQRQDGSWKDDYWTGTGFPGVFYLRYHLYAVYFPLLALSIYDKRMKKDQFVVRPSGGSS